VKFIEEANAEYTFTVVRLAHPSYFELWNHNKSTPQDVRRVVIDLRSRPLGLPEAQDLDLKPSVLIVYPPTIAASVLHKVTWSGLNICS
jgi:hypothetical protein